MSEPRRTFGPVLLLGLAAGILAAVASSRTWVVDAGGSPHSTDPLGTVTNAGEMPLAAALSLVVLACWGVLLVTRRTVRRAVAVLGLLASAGLTASVVVGWTTLPDAVTEAIAEQTGSGDGVAVDTTAWFWAAAVGAFASLVATALAARWVPLWPEMGSRYDAPGTADPTPEPEDASSLDLWKAMDEGRDPTA